MIAKCSRCSMSFTSSTLLEGSRHAEPNSVEFADGLGGAVEHALVDRVLRNSNVPCHYCASG
jgi:hypothetical protein